MTTTQPTTALGQRRIYAYEPLHLDPASTWKDLSHCQFVASQTLRNIRVTWDREEEDTLRIHFTNPQGAQFKSCWSVGVDDPADYDESDPAAVAHFALNQAGWTIESTLLRESDQREMDNDEVFGTVDGRLIMVADIWPALQALHTCVCAHSQRIYGIHDPQESLFCRNTEAASHANDPEQPGGILAEKRVLTYQDYLLNLDGLDINLSPREQAALSLMADIHITWEGDGDPSTLISFIAPNEFGYSADVVPIWEQETGAEACWGVEVHSNMTAKLVKRADVYNRLPGGETVTFDNVIGVMVVLHQFLSQCEEDGYPDFDEQMV